MTKFLYLLLIVPLASEAQVNINNLSLTDSTKQILYVGVDNKIKFSGGNIDKFTKSIEGAGGMLTRLESDLFLVRVNRSGDTAIIKLSSENKIIAKKKFKVEAPPDIVATIGYIKDSIASINRILANPYITTGCNCYLNLKISIWGFEMKTEASGQEEITLSTTNSLTDEQLKLIKESRPGDKLYFQRIRATRPDERTRLLKPFTITIQ